MRYANKTYDARVDRDHEPRTVEERLARLELSAESRSFRLGALLFAAFVVYLLWTLGVLKFDFPAAASG